MLILIACEFSGTVRDAFRAQGHNAWSCDILPPEIGATGLAHIYHFQGDVRRILDGHIPADMVKDSAYRGTPGFLKWDLMIAHPPCTHLAVSGARWFKDKLPEQAEAIRFAETLWGADIPRIAIENPVSILSTRSILGRPAQIIQPWQFGHGETKATCLWLKGLPKLVPTDIVSGREARIHKMAPSPDRWKERSKTYQGIADAMAQQWGTT